MATGAIRVTPEELSNGSMAFSRTATEVDGSHKTLKGRIDTLTTEGWTGMASSSFQQLYEKFNRSAQELSDATRGIGTLLQQASDAYSGNEGNLAHVFGAGR